MNGFPGRRREIVILSDAEHLRQGPRLVFLWFVQPSERGRPDGWITKPLVPIRQAGEHVSEAEGGVVGFEQETSGLEAAAESAVATSGQELDGLEHGMRELTSEISAALARMKRIGDIDGPGVKSFEAATAEIAIRFDDFLTAQREVLSSLNIALFGRTGAGKSTLLSALGQLDGSRVSPGDSDWTLAVEEVEWHGCRLIDTPGIGGWGGRMARRDLEDAARRAVEVADLVILCFDTQNQLPSEFEKIACWVQEFGRPVIVVLNVRIDHWRRPDKARTRQRREQLSDTVRQHAQHISEGLGHIGIPDVPVVALHSQRALCARASTPYRGPNKTSLLIARERYGADLIIYSNYPVLEALITEAIKAGGSDFRTTALREGARGLFREMATSLKEYEQGSQEPLFALDRSIGSMLDVLGYPDDDDSERRAALRSRTLEGDALTLYETARQEPFTAQRKGSAERYGGHLLESRLGAERSLALRRVEKLTTEAFAQRRVIDERQFSKAVIDEPAIRKVVDEIWRECAGFLNDQLDLAIAEGVTDVRFLQASVRVRGDSGRGFRRGGQVMQALGGLGNAVLAILAVGALLNWWNPIGWAGFLVGGLAAGVAKWFGGRTAKAAEGKKVRALAQARADSRRVVNEYFDELQGKLSGELMTEAWSSAAPRLVSTLESGVAIRTGLHEISRLGSAASEAAESVALSPDAWRVISDAVATVAAARDRGPHGRSAAATLLGEDWIDSDGWTAVEPESFVHPQRQLLVEQQEVDWSLLTHALRSMWTSPTADAVLDWMGLLEVASSADPELAAVLETAQEIFTGLPRVAVVGDYSAGKSSLIKRLLVEGGLPVPDGLSVRAQPTTESVREYRLRRSLLVDTPGFQSGSEGHDHTAIRAVADAAVVVFVVHNNLITGDLTWLDQLLLGGEDRLPKLGRTLFLINQSEGLVAGDPGDDPAGYLRARRRREAELARALQSRGVDLPDGRIFAIASDPFGSVGDSDGAVATDYSAGRDWDGISPLRAAFIDLEGDLVASGQPIAALEGSATRLLELSAGIRNSIERTSEEIVSQRRVIEALEMAGREAETVGLSLRAEASRIADEHAQSILNSALGATEAELPAAARRLSRWWLDPAFTQDVERFNVHARRDADDWFATHSSTLYRDIRNSVFRGASVALDLEFEHSRLHRGLNAARVVGQPVSFGGKVTAALSKRDVYYALRKKMGVKFKPWGAVKGAQKFAKLGAALAVVGVGIDAAEWVVDRRNEQTRDRARADAIRYMAYTSRMVAEELIGSSTDSSGLLGYLAQMASGLGQQARDIEAELNQNLATRGALRARSEVIAGLLDPALALLRGTEPEGDTQWT